MRFPTALAVLLLTLTAAAEGIPPRAPDVHGAVMGVDGKAQAIVLEKLSVVVGKSTFVFVATGKTGHRGTFADVKTGDQVSVWKTKSGAVEAVEIFRPGDGAFPH